MVGAAVRAPHVDGAQALPPVQLVAVDVIRSRVAAAEEEQGGASDLPAPIIAARSWMNPRKGASPAPAAMKMTGTEVASAGRWKAAWEGRTETCSLSPTARDER